MTLSLSLSLSSPESDPVWVQLRHEFISDVTE